MMLLTPCLEWNGNRDKHGYGIIRRPGRSWWRVHRWVWALANGPIEDHLVVMHACDNPPCFRLDHLRLGTQGDNQRDMTSKGRNGMTARTHCPNGHPYDAINTRIETSGGRRCRACERNRTQLRLKSERGEKAA